MTNKAKNGAKRRAAVLMSAAIKIAAACTVAIASPAAAEAAASILPLHSLVQAVMGDGGQVRLIVDSGASPHGFQLRPSHLKLLREADIVFYAGDELESFLPPLLRLHPVNAVALVQTPGLKILPRRNAIDAHDGREDPDFRAHKHGGDDMHFWLDVDNAKILADEIARRLGETYPARRDDYRRNVGKLKKRLAATDAEIQKTLSPLRDKPFAVVHDAYQYFVRRYQLRQVAAIARAPGESPGIRRLLRVRKRIVDSGAVCVFGEPSISLKLPQTAAEGTAAKIAVIDPLGSTLSPGADLYPNLLRQMADTMARCLL